jgi:hypothetical protein
MKKDVIYIDNEDEITSITEKLQDAKSQIVALVLPKRCTVLQSSVNMKILKKAADNAGKNMVLITSEKSLLLLAGLAGVYTAKTLQSKPELVSAAVAQQDNSDTIDDADIDKNKSVGELAGVDEDAIDIGEEATKAEPQELQKKKDNKLKVPNFDSFRLKLFLIIGGILLALGLWFVAFRVLPKATVIVTTENRTAVVNTSFTASANATGYSEENRVIPAETKTLTKTESDKFDATGEKNTGSKSSGKVSFSIPCSGVVGGDFPTIPSGTGISSGGLTFITQESTTLSNLGGGCVLVGDDVSVVAQSPGDQYNINSGRTFSVSGFSAVSATNNEGFGGGTNKIVKTVSSSDCNNVKDQLLNANTDEAKQELEAQIKEAGLTPIDDTFTYKAGNVTCNPKVGTEASEFTASVQFTYSMAGVNTADLESLIKKDASEQLEGSQEVLDTGLDDASISVKTRNPNGDYVVAVATNTQVGIKQDPNAIAEGIAGKKKGESYDIIRSLPGVKEVEIKYSPFWVTKTPSNPSKIKVEFINQDGQTN